MIGNYVAEASVPTILLFCVICKDVDNLYKWQKFRPIGLHQSMQNLVLMKVFGAKNESSPSELSQKRVEPFRIDVAGTPPKTTNIVVIVTVNIVGTCTSVVEGLSVTNSVLVSS